MSSDDPNRADSAFVSEVAGRFGVLPNFFCSAPAAAGLIEELWIFAKSAYLDSPLPSLFKERLFVHLSRFCEVRYCIVRHVGFLMGEGRPAGDPDAQPLTLEQTIRLLRRPVPDAVRLGQAFQRLEACVEPCELPLSDTEEETQLFDALTVMFLVPARSARARDAVRKLAGERNFELLAAFLAFVRTAHYWTEMHPELAYEPDMVACMARHPELAALLVDTDEAAEASPAIQLRRALNEVDRVKGALDESEERLRQFGEASSDVLWIRDAETLQWIYLTPAFETIYGLDRETALRGDNMTGWLDLIVPEDRQTALDAIESVRAGERASFEYRVRRPVDGAVRWLRNTDFPMRDAAGQICWIGGVGRDITEAKAAAQRQEVLVNELQHRARNLLGVVTAVAGRTLREGGSVDAFEERLQALSRAQGLLSQAGSDTVEIEALVRAELAAHAQDGSERVCVAGPAMHLTARQVQNFALALHELTTNAVKYGALKDGTGQLEITWELVLDKRERRRLALSWIESGVPVRPGAVTRHGYGTELIQEALAYALEADVDYVLGEDGVRCRIEMPVA